MVFILTSGTLLGLSAGFAPGPLLTRVISETHQHDIKTGIKVALAKAITDLPIMLLALILFFDGRKLFNLTSYGDTMHTTINAYLFGRIIINGKEFTSDLTISPEGLIQETWWRSEGHNLIPGDIPSLLDARPGTLVVGTGANGLMNVSNDLLDECQKRGITIEAHPTGEAVKVFNEATLSGGIVAACFHLTC